MNKQIFLLFLVQSFGWLAEAADVPSPGNTYFIRLAHDSSYLTASGDNKVCEKLGTVYTTQETSNGLAMRWEYRFFYDGLSTFTSADNRIEFSLNDFTMRSGAPWCYHVYKTYFLLAVGNGQYQIKDEHSGKCLAGYSASGGNAITWDNCSPLFGQGWIFERTSI